MYGRHHDLINHYAISMTLICSECHRQIPVLVHDSSPDFEYSNTTGVISGAGTENMGFTLVSLWGFTLLNIQFYEYCYVDHCMHFCHLVLVIEMSVLRYAVHD